MPFQNLRDWARKQQILASDMQGHTDRLRAVYPLTFSGNVQTMGGAQQGMHVHIPPPSQFTTTLPLLHLTAAATGGGQYIVREVSDPDTWDSTTDLTATSLGDDGADDCLLINLLEIEAGTHWLTHADNTDQKYFRPASRWPIKDEEGRTIYDGNFVWVQSCTPTPTPTPSPSPPP